MQVSYGQSSFCPAAPLHPWELISLLSLENEQAMGFDDADIGRAVKTPFIISKKESPNKDTVFAKHYKMQFSNKRFLDFVVLVF